MNTLTRLVASGPGAIVVTTGLGLVMAKLIHVPFVALPDKPEQLSFRINPEITPSPPITKRVLKPVQRVEIPPARPILETSTTKQVGVPIYTADFIPPWKDLAKTIKPAKVTVELSFIPIHRAKPPMPTRAQRSGHCDVIFDVNASGSTYNVNVLTCSQSIFSRASIQAAQKWKYRAQVIDGKSVPRTGIRTTITFRLTDEHGRVIPE